MKRSWKIALWTAAAAVAVGGGVFAAVKYNQRGIVTVQTGRAARQDLVSIVTASGEIKPRNYVNIGANVMGRITHIDVAEGDRVRRSQVLARLEAVQAEADVQAQQAALLTAEAESAAAEAGLVAHDANIRTAEAAVDRAKAELERARADYGRAVRLLEDLLIPRQEFEQRKSAYLAQEAGLREAEARLAQLRAQRQQTAAQLSASQRRVAQMQALLRRSDDVLQKHAAISPIDGIVTNLPVRVGETVVPGIQNSPASLIMTIADMSLITAEVKVDETDIVNVRLGQEAEVTIDAIPNRTFRGSVIEIGNTAILRSTGLAASQSAIASQEAKDFKVVIALEDPPETIRPGLSCTGRITTATRDNALAIPLQALTVRQRGDVEEAEGARQKEEVQGVFVIQGDKALFRPVATGIIGATDIEVKSGLKEGEEIITGSFKVIRTLRNETRVTVDNQASGRPES
ncbi:MAG: efflux RND transporter periplasmic adaptor subunit [Bryobacteraceae bacterium]